MSLLLWLASCFPMCSCPSRVSPERGRVVHLHVWVGRAGAGAGAGISSAATPACRGLQHESYCVLPPVVPLGPFHSAILGGCPSGQVSNKTQVWLAPCAPAGRTARAHTQSLGSALLFALVSAALTRIGMHSAFLYAFWAASATLAGLVLGGGRRQPGWGATLVLLVLAVVPIAGGAGHCTGVEGLLGWGDGGGRVGAAKARQGLELNCSDSPGPVCVSCACLLPCACCAFLG